MKTLFGWAGKILRVNLGDGSASDISTMGYASKFIGGKGIASRMYWEEMNSKTSAFDPDNHLYFLNGPLAGTKAKGASRSVVLGKSPMAFPEQYASGNLGGRIGAYLKWAGLDGLVITGASDKPVILVIEPSGKYSIEDASGLWGKDTDETIEILEKRFGSKASILTIGEAGEKKIRFATIIGSHGISATKGFGAVMGSKKLKAIVVKADRVSLPVAHPDKLKEINRQITSLIAEETSERYFTELMHEGVEKVKNVPCYGCPGICRRGIYRSAEGEQGYRKTCASAFYYSTQEINKTGKMSSATFHATQLANKHGLCVLELHFLANWLPEAMRKGIVNIEEAGLNLDELGTSGWIGALINLITSRKGIGDILAEGSPRSTKELGAEDLLEGMVTKTGFNSNNLNPRLFNVNAPIYATEPVYPIMQLHRAGIPMIQWMIWMGTEGMLGFLTTKKLRSLARQFWGSEEAAEFDTTEKKGQAAVLSQNRCYAMENVVFCEWFWPIDFSGAVESGVGDPSLEAALFSSITGWDMDEAGYLGTGERSANLCRAIYLCEGRRGRIDDVLEEFNFTSPLEKQPPPVDLFNPEYMMPGKDGELFTRLGETMSRESFKIIMDDYYKTRGWDTDTGLFTKSGLKKLDLEDLIPTLDKKGFINS